MGLWCEGSLGVCIIASTSSAMENELGDNRFNTVAVADTYLRSVHCVTPTPTARNRVQEADSDTATFLQNDCDCDQDHDQARSTTTTIFSRARPGSVVADSSRSRSAEPPGRHRHVAQRRASWSPGSQDDLLRPRHHDNHHTDKNAAVNETKTIAGVAGRVRADRGTTAASSSSQQPAAAASSKQPAASSQQ